MAIKELFISLRPRQWAKNTFIFIPLFFSQNLLNAGMLLTILAAFLIFCLLSGCAYIINDFMDIEEDKRHPVKSTRPMASGRLDPKTALMFSGVVILLCLAAALLINTGFAKAAAAYMAVQIAYSLFLKHVIILDVFSIGATFFLRVMAGGAAIAVPISSWLLICTIFISLFLALGKRRHELLMLEDAGGHRKVLDEYNIRLVDQMVSIASAGTVISYALYTLSQETVEKFDTQNLWYTTPIVFYGVSRYLFLVYKREEGGSPEELLFKDRPLLISLLLYVLVVLTVLYL